MAVQYKQGHTHGMCAHVILMTRTLIIVHLQHRPDHNIMGYAFHSLENLPARLKIKYGTNKESTKLYRNHFNGSIFERVECVTISCMPSCTQVLYHVGQLVSSQKGFKTTMAKNNITPVILVQFLKSARRNK